jgi:hypothetical protein
MKLIGKFFGSVLLVFFAAFTTASAHFTDEGPVGIGHSIFNSPHLIAIGRLLGSVAPYVALLVIIAIVAFLVQVRRSQ